MSASGMLFGVALLLYIVSAGLYHVSLVQPGVRRPVWPWAAAMTGLAFHTAAIVERSVTLGQAPYVELRGAVMTVAWMIVLLNLLMEWRRHTAVLGVPAMPIAALLMVMADTLPVFGRAHPLMPALYRNPMTAHIGSIVAAFGCFGLAFCFALLYMVQERRLKQKRVASRPGGLSLAEIDDLANGFTAFGFTLLTLGLALGVLWAASGVWAGRWYTDPVVLATTATWMIYAAYLFMRGVKGARGRSNMYLLIIGFAMVVATLLVVRPILPGRHGI